MKRRYKDFITIKFSSYSRTKSLFNAKLQRHHSARTHRGMRGVLLEPRLAHRSEKYERYVPAVFDRETWQCDTRHCQNVGYGPVLRNIVWNKRFQGVNFMCEPCMMRRLGRPIGPYDLRNCPMNIRHPAFVFDMHLSL